MSWRKNKPKHAPWIGAKQIANYFIIPFAAEPLQHQVYYFTRMPSSFQKLLLAVSPGSTVLLLTDPMHDPEDETPSPACIAKHPNRKSSRQFTQKD
ncbi:conserved hypothetical protein [Ricinus communis]|uniref:Uncharacterized protein n=1 Tax=Ricinus communis TaxID=3988 RepID=B9RT62_RICCO|nr:conserved hypothetical protein [Ricinus communis]